MKRVEIARSAQADLRAVRTYILEHNPPTATRDLEDLASALRHLADWPMSGRSGEQYRPGLRIYVRREHLIYYRPSRSGIVIVRVIHGRRDQSGIFR